MESVEREVRWLNELIESERAGRDLKGPASGANPRQDTTSGTSGDLPRPGDDPRPGWPDDSDACVALGLTRTHREQPEWVRFA
ncbi:hypothetical protein SHIRM173S_10186 [Streptomyces hirsutus]